LCAFQFPVTCLVTWRPRTTTDNKEQYRKARSASDMH